MHKKTSKLQEEAIVCDRIYAVELIFLFFFGCHQRPRGRQANRPGLHVCIPNTINQTGEAVHTF